MKELNRSKGAYYRTKQAVTPPVAIRKSIIERIKPLGWSVIAIAVGLAVALIVTNI